MDQCALPDKLMGVPRRFDQMAPCSEAAFRSFYGAALCTGACAHVQASEKESGDCAGSINVSDVLTGRSMARVTAPACPRSNAERATRTALCGEYYKLPVTWKQVGECDQGIDVCWCSCPADVTSLFFDEEASEIYTGTAWGGVHRWSS